MEKQFSVAPQQKAIASDTSKRPSVDEGFAVLPETQTGQVVAQDLQTIRDEHAARVEPTLKVVPPQLNPIQHSSEVITHQTIEERLTKLEKEMELISARTLEAQPSTEVVPKTTTSPSLAQHDLVVLGFDQTLVDDAISSQKAWGKPISNIDLITHISQQAVSHEVSNTLNADILLVVGPSGSGKTTLSAKFATIIGELKKSRALKFVNLEDKSRPQVGLLRHYAKLLGVPLSRWSIAKPHAWRPIDSNTIHIVDLACTTDQVIEIWPKLQTHFDGYKLQVLMAIPSGLAVNRLADELDKAVQLNAQVVLTKIDEYELSIPEVSQLITKSAKVGWLTGTLELSGNLAKATFEIMEQYLLGYVIEKEYDTDASTDVEKSDMDAS
jgi:flagellar biosynthesis protein FlhF